MKTLRIALIATLAAAFLVGTANAQRKTASKPAPKKTAVTTVIAPLEVRAARSKVTTQYENVNLFVNKFGPIAVALETLETEYATKKPTPQKLAAHETNKKNVVQTIRNLRDGLAVLESEFRTKAELRRYLVNIDGISGLAARAEDSAIAGKFVLSKEPLRAAAQKLLDTLAVMPKGEI
jgi:hypothetical protein